MAISSRGEGGVGGARGGGTGGSVKVVPARRPSVNATMNRHSDIIVKNMKSGRLAKSMSEQVDKGHSKKTIKINSAPAKSADAAKAKADAKALKAANKGKKK